MWGGHLKREMLAAKEVVWLSVVPKFNAGDRGWGAMRRDDRPTDRG